MSTILKSILGPSSGGSFRDGANRVPSLNDLSMGAGMDLDDMLPTDTSARRTSSELSRGGAPTLMTGPAPPKMSNSGNANIWSSVFNPGRNPNMPKSAERFDTANPGAPSTWEYIVKAEKLSNETFTQLDTEGHGYLTPEELGRGLHIDISQVQALLKQADSNGDGKISYDEWVDVLKKSGANSVSPSSPKTPKPGAPPKAGSWKVTVPEPCPDHVTAFTSSKPEEIAASRRRSEDFQKGLKEARETVLGSSPGGIDIPQGGSFRSGSPKGSPKAADVWSSVFNPGRNYNMPKTAERFDIAHTGAPSTWEYIKTAEKAK